MSYVLGVDGGNTKTIALVARADGAVAGWGRSGCGDIYGEAGTTGALDHIRRACAAALAAAGIGAGDLAGAVFSLAGADWPEDFDFLASELAPGGAAGPTRVVNDALGALRAGTDDGAGVSVVCGTGTAIGARGADGRVWHVSFWLSEAGGANDLGRRAWQAILRAELGIDPPTALTARACQAFGAPDVETFLHQATRRSGDGFEMSALAPILLEAGAGGDATAARLVAEYGHTLGDYANVAARKAGLAGRPFDLVLSGGVFRSNSTRLAGAILERVQAVSPGARPVLGAAEPAVGALLLAFEVAGITADRALRARLEPTLPPASFYATAPIPFQETQS